MMTDDYEDTGPESDPYCAHWISIFDDRHGNIPCQACGHSCKDHPVLWGGGCHSCSNDHVCVFENEAWPLGEIRPSKE